MQHFFRFILFAIFSAFLLSATAFGSHNSVTRRDFDGDGRADIGVYRNGEWFILKSSSGFSQYEHHYFGPAASPLPADYDGDGRADLAVVTCAGANFRFDVKRSSDGVETRELWGLCGVDTPFRVVSDWDGDGKADLTVFRGGAEAGQQSNFFIKQSSNGAMRVIPWGIFSDMASTGDYDGDGLPDAAVRRLPENTNFIRRSSDGGMLAAKFGIIGVDNPVMGDFDGDQRTDFAVYRHSPLGVGNDGGTWYVQNILHNSVAVTRFGAGFSDSAVPADYDGDGKTDIAVFRRSTGDWYVLKSSGGMIILHWGQENDIPLTGTF